MRVQSMPVKKFVIKQKNINVSKLVEETTLSFFKLST